MWEYTDTVMDNFYHPKNMGTMDDANAVGEVGSIVCGDALKLYLKIKDNRIEDAKFQTFGCGSAIASSSMLTELIKGKTIEEAKKITNQDIVDALGGLPKEKMHCSVMGQEALEAAIKNFYGESSEHTEEDEGRLVCRCFNVHEKKLRQHIIENKLKTLQDVMNYTKAGGGCGSCRNEIQDILEDVWTHELAKEADQPVHEIKKEEKQGNKMNNLQRITKIQTVIETKIKPALADDGGGIDLMDIEGNKVYVKLCGACSCCPSAQFTLYSFVEQTLRDEVSPDIQLYEYEE